MTRRHISELADKVGVTPRTIRYYVEQGLLPPPAGSGQHVRYGLEHYRRLLAIRELASRRLSLKEIRGILESQAPGALEGEETSARPSLDLAEWLGEVRAGRPHYFRGLALYALHCPGPPISGLPEFLTLSEAVGGDHLRIVGTHGAHPGRLQVRNASRRFVLLLGGQEIHGNGQSHRITRSLLIAPGVAMWIPGAACPPPARTSASPGSCSALEGYRRAFGLPAGALGVAAAIAGRLQAADLFGHPDLLARHWTSLVSAHASEALLAPETAPPAPADVDLLLRRASRAPLREGRDENGTTVFDVNGEAVSGSGVAHEKRPVHLALFPRDDSSAASSEADDRPPGGIRLRMAGPARRRGLGSQGPGRYDGPAGREEP